MGTAPFDGYGHGRCAAREDGALVERLLLGPGPAYTAVIDRSAVERTVREWRAGAPHHNLLLALVMLELWLSEYLPRALSSVPAIAAA